LVGAALATFGVTHKPPVLNHAKELAYLEERHPNFHLQIVVEDTSGIDWQGLTGRLTTEQLSSFVPELPRSRVYLCGPAPMMKAVGSMLEGLGVPPDQVLTELFSTPVEQIERDEAAAWPKAPAQPGSSSGRPAGRCRSRPRRRCSTRRRRPG